MPTAIAVTSADLVLPAPDRHTPGAAVLHPPGRLDLEGALAETSTLLEGHGHLVALVPSWLPPATVQRLHTVRAILETDRIALLDIDLPPLGTALLVRQLRQLSVCDFSPGVIASAARLLSHYIYAGALLGSVAKLDRVPVGLKAHARSWSPSAQFAVLAHPAPHLVRLGGSAASRGSHGSRGSHSSHGAGAALPAGPEFATHLTFARGQLASDWVAAELAPAWQVQGVMENPLPADSPAWWGTQKLVEFAAGIPDPNVLYQLVASVRRDECRWCGLELIGDRCGFCSAPLSAPPPAGAGTVPSDRPERPDRPDRSARTDRSARPERKIERRTAR
ncbi:hypothetical protein [Streptomyces sp. NBC_01408]|uniref:hypothetical protein n=1 Tax=Streptomyces sp. NBC_01408 TaxID=2903855 RepID=UPI002258E9C5|nr:hypothetical protein [Streptomyces sp. NBC_01408]MCX4691307.1 hypothetical protein [Streptomyces sp. NBC_01408]